MCVVYARAVVVVVFVAVVLFALLFSRNSVAHAHRKFYLRNVRARAPVCNVCVCAEGLGMQTHEGVVDNGERGLLVRGISGWHYAY